MTVNQVHQKLRQYNRKNYYLLFFCIVLSVMLITSYALMYLSPTVQNILPEGGDSRKQAWMVFSVAIVGCGLFTTYASSLFLKYKSKEIGTFMALGMNKSQVKKQLFRELMLIATTGSLLGMVLALPVAYGIWRVFQLIIIDTEEMTFQLGWSGFLCGVLFASFVLVSMGILGSRFIQRSNIMDILYDQRKNEPMGKVKSWYGVVGVALVVFGMAMGYLGQSFMIVVMRINPSFLWNGFYLLAAIGIYMIMIHVVVHSRKGKHPKKYYDRIISISMMKFQGRQTVNNMCVITFLIGGALFASFYTPMAIGGSFYSYNNDPVDYVFRYPGNEQQIGQEEIGAMAEEYGVNITWYDEIAAIGLITDGIETIWEDDGRIVDYWYEQHQINHFVSEQQFMALTGQDVDIAPGKYGYIGNGTDDQSIYFSHSGVSKLTHQETGTIEDIAYQQTLNYSPLNGIYVLDEEDYQRHNQEIPLQRIEHNVLFNVENVDDTYLFGKGLIQQIIDRSSPEAGVLSWHDEYQEQLTLERGEEYHASQRLNLEKDSPDLARAWKYYPQFRIVNKQDMMQNMAVFILLFIYISIICFTAVSIIAYTRSMTIALNNKQVYQDLIRLGANRQYIVNALKQQLKKIFVFPTVIGTTVVFGLFLMICLGNGHTMEIEPSEWPGIIISIFIALGACGYMYGLYRFTLNKVLQVILNEK